MRNPIPTSILPYAHHEKGHAASPCPPRTPPRQSVRPSTTRGIPGMEWVDLPYGKHNEMIEEMYGEGKTRVPWSDDRRQTGPRFE